MPTVEQIRHFLYIPMTCLFFYELWLAFSKLSNGLPGTVIEHTGSPWIEIPAISFCDATPPIMVRKDNSQSMGELLGDALNEELVDSFEFEDENYRDFELTDATVLRDKFGLEHEDVWQTIFLIVHNKEAHLPHFLFKCVYFELPLKVPSSLSSKLKFKTNKGISLMFHEKGQTVYSYNRFLGNSWNQEVMSNHGSGRNTSMQIAVEKSVSTHLNREGWKCDKDNNQNIRKCLAEYVDREMAMGGCILPWRTTSNSTATAGPIRECSTKDDLARFLSVTEMWSSILDFDGLLNTTGCKINCKITAYSSSTVRRDISKSNNGYRHMVELIMSQVTIRHEDEIYTYDLNNFVADAGGFLGLLLGISAMDLVYFGAMVRKKFKSKEMHRKRPSNLTQADPYPNPKKKASRRQFARKLNSQTT